MFRGAHQCASRSGADTPRSQSLYCPDKERVVRRQRRPTQWAGFFGGRHDRYNRIVYNVPMSTSDQNDPSHQLPGQENIELGRDFAATYFDRDRSAQWRMLKWTWREGGGQADRNAWKLRLLLPLAFVAWFGLNLLAGSTLATICTVGAMLLFVVVRLPGHWRCALEHRRKMDALLADRAALEDPEKLAELEALSSDEFTQ
jgi:hypothetical protein